MASTKFFWAWHEWFLRDPDCQPPLDMIPSLPTGLSRHGVRITHLNLDMYAAPSCSNLSMTKEHRVNVLKAVKDLRTLKYDQRRNYKARSGQGFRALVRLQPLADFLSTITDTSSCLQGIRVHHNFEALQEEPRLVHQLALSR